MEHAFDALSKRLARGVSRREAISTLLRGAVGAFLVSAGFTKFSLHAQSGSCTACGTCAMTDGSKLVACTDPCGAQTLCNTAQSYAPYQALVTTLAALSFQATTYDSLLSGTGKKQTQVFHTAYVNPTDSSSTADLAVVWASGGQVSAFATQYQNGSPLWGYVVNGTSVVQIAPPPQIPGPFAISASPSSVTVTEGSWGMTTISTTVSSGFSSAIALKASGLPSRAKASFSPSSIPAPGSGSSIMTIKAGASTPAGTYTITVTGTGQGITETTSVSLTVGPAGATADPFEVSDSTPQTPDVVSGEEISGISGLTAQPAIHVCGAGCNVIGYAAGYLSGDFCELAVDVIGSDACVSFSGPALPYCEEAVVMASFGALTACKNGAKKLAKYLCKQLLCACPPCQVKNGLSCVSMCQDSEPGQPGYCPPPGFCDPTSCACVTNTCPPGDTPCGTACCSAGETCCGSACCSSGQTCSNGQCVASCPSGFSNCGPTGCCLDGAPCCQDPLSGAYGCGPIGNFCCPLVGNCPPGTTCCGVIIGVSEHGACCDPGDICVITSAGAFCCPSTGCPP